MDRDKVIQFEVKMMPEPKRRPRFGYGKVFTHSSDIGFEHRFRHWTSKYKPTFAMAGPVTLDIELYLPFPAKPKDKHWPVNPASGDVDNYAKAIMDSMQSKKIREKITGKQIVVDRGFFQDDCQVVGLNVRKYYSYIHKGGLIKVVLKPI